jgi:hypothetical protein
MRLRGASGSRAAIAVWAKRTALRHIARACFGVVLFTLLAASAVSVATVVASGPSAEPTLRPLTCAERYPDEGPAGLDLRLACIVTKLVGAYATPGDASTPPRLSDWLRPMGVAMLVLILIWFVIRTVTRRAATRLAPVVPASWWSCPACRSLNPSGTMACYSCRQPWSPDLEVLRPSDPPS